MMDMEISEEVSMSNDQMIVKGKRTKRPRLSSSTSSCGGGYGSGGGGGEFYNSLIVSSSSPTTSSGISTSTEEDEDMANCLILLARGGGGGCSDEIKPSETKFNSRKFTEMATTTIGKVGIYVYECKTCSRTFPSFQALGGHRASHKKPKIAADSDDRKKSPPPAPPLDVDHEEDEESGGKFTKLNAISTPPPPTQLVNKIEIKPKIHECSICGSEFASGQALGGHMRRHRPVANTRSVNDSTTSHEAGDQKTRNVLVLDLNLPAPPEDDVHRETKFHEFSSNQQPRLVFSAAPLVDCHY
ncbi:hypothetical protein BUALT_Bualt02G0036600 [Buddleja alternifolia]|uniref:C2H2-type domain-containing protein n=1 Tax=Buddleja alternifolia TaxID=168488 RepID=A0AAV6Y8C1_9LAMI|nr:hypothetical protein BUALT_Bualt02G0036600 [Buddleja alternifolia]